MKSKFRELGDAIYEVCKNRNELEIFIDEYSLFRGGYDNVFLNCNNLLSTIENDSEVFLGLSDNAISCLNNFLNIVIKFNGLDNDSIDKLYEFNVFNNDLVNSMKGITDLLIKYFFI